MFELQLIAIALSPALFYAAVDYPYSSSTNCHFPYGTMTPKAFLSWVLASVVDQARKSKSGTISRGA